MLIPDDRGIAAAVRRRLGDLGIGSVEQRHVPDNARGVLYLGGLRTVETLDEAIAIHCEAFETAVAYAQKRRDSGLFVTVQDTGGHLGVSAISGARAWIAGLAGLAKTAAREWPDVCVRAIDVARGSRGSDAIAEAIVRELCEGAGDREIGLSEQGERFILKASEARAVPAQPVPSGAVIVASGGARGVTAECLLELAERIQPRLLLLGRSPLEEEPDYLLGAEGDAALKRAILTARKSLTPRELTREAGKVTAMREIRRNLARFEKAGAVVRYASVDVRDEAAVSALLADVREQWGPVQVLVHGAGILADALLEKRSGAEQFDQVFDTKVRGLSTLLSAMRPDPLVWICLFSSIAARDGNRGQADYAMANEVLNKVAAFEAEARKGQCRVTAIGWGPWEGGMVTPQLAKHFASQGVELIPLRAGAEAFAAESQSSGDVEILLVAGGNLPEPERSLQAQITAGLKSMPHLEGHRIRGQVVLPVVCGIDWFSRLCASSNEAALPICFAEFRVLRGAILPDFADREEVFDLRLDRDGKAELRDRSGAVRLSARALAATDALASRGAVNAPRPGVFLEGSLYGAGRLFHTQRFQLIREVQSLSEDGASALVAGVIDAGWGGRYPWCDPAMLDAGLQLALLCGICAGMGQSLPLAIGRVILYRPPEAGSIHCVVATRSRTSDKARYDIVFKTLTGQALAELHDVEMYVMPNRNEAAE